MSHAEVTDLLNEEAIARAKARTLAHIACRAARLWADGYTATQTMRGRDVTTFRVTSPDGTRYSVKLTKTPAPAGSFFGDSCTCPCWQKLGECKHHLAMLETQREREQCEAHDALVANAETADGCDPYARY